MFNFYNISRFENGYNFQNKPWNDILDCLKYNNKNIICEYQFIEGQFVEFLKMFIDYFSTNNDESTHIDLGFHLIIADLDNIQAEYLYGLESPIERLFDLRNLNLSGMNDDDLLFLIKAWMRGLCYLYFFDILTGSFIRKSDDFNFLLMLHSNYDIRDIFQSKEGVFISVEMDVISHCNVNIPEDYGRYINL